MTPLDRPRARKRHSGAGVSGHESFRNPRAVGDTRGMLRGRGPAPGCGALRTSCRGIAASGPVAASGRVSLRRRAGARSRRSLRRPRKQAQGRAQKSRSVSKPGGHRKNTTLLPQRRRNGCRQEAAGGCLHDRQITSKICILNVCFLDVWYLVTGGDADRHQKLGAERTDPGDPEEGSPYPVCTRRHLQPRNLAACRKFLYMKCLTWLD